MYQNRKIHFEVSACQQQWAHVFAERVFFSLSAPRIDAFVRARASFLATELSVNAGSTLILKVGPKFYFDLRF